ncbi:helix-turn-helix domain-containing protein [Aeromicrobium ginsengisoli]|uniref:helix-turn-helix domain-containing protein n=1 Tax=Aeromicrobium ginsengisoli TaxID=363867 RepID=UPI001CB73A99|nr:helix-turn-helix transcriptional regulator [Aeromicrobium ginsengisoli]
MNRLTDRENQVLSLLAQGLANRAIADRLGMTERTAETHVSRIFWKLDLPDDSTVHRRVHAALAHERALVRED